MTPIALARYNILFSLGILGLKYAAYALTGSVSLYSDALESIVNVAAALMALYAIQVAAQPPDREHPFGHTKAEFLSAVAEGALILFAAVEIARAAGARLLAPVPLEGLTAGLALSSLAGVLTAAWAAFLIRTGRKRRSPALVADGKHLWTDVVSTGGVLVGILLANATGWWILDPILAMAVAINVVIEGLRLMRESMGGLMDESLPDAQMDDIQQIIRTSMDGAIEAHALRSRTAGRHRFIEFHLVVPGSMSVEASHAICDRLETALVAGIADCSVTIHVEPEGKAKHLGPVARLRD
ncbi:MAG: cation diffusion facilitator family transporter [Rhodothermales bacterium]|nr:cation diffusion facilitator family transporter [Rhodothermales bacterium]